MTRDFEQLWRDGLCPGQGLMPDPFESLRHQAIMEALTRLPDGDYDRLLRLVDSFEWFVPHCDTGAQVVPFPITTETDDRRYAAVLYLSPSLEWRAWDVVVGIVAHELAHVLLGHEVFTHPKTYDAQEKAAWELVSGWGFEREARKVKRVGKWRDSYERYRVQKLLADQQLDLP